MPLSQIPEVLCLSGCSASPHHQFSASLPVNVSQPLPTLLPEGFETKDISLYIEKSKLQLTLFHGGEPIKSYAMVLGQQPQGDKRREGDNKTPEGVFQIRDLYPHPSWSKFIWLNYPTGQSWRKHFAAKLSGEIGLWDTVGSEVGIHGVPEGADRWIATQKHWTWGCVSLTNSDVDEIYEALSQDSIIEIVP